MLVPTLRRPFALLAIALLVLVGGAGPAAAHARLLSSTPQGGATIDGAPQEIVLRFNEDIEPDFTQVQVTSATGARVDAGTPDVRGAEVTQPLGELTDGGRYRVAFRVVSADGHPVQSTFSFSMAAPVAQPGPQPVPGAVAPEPAPAAPPAQTTPTASAEEAASPLPLVLVGAAVVGLLIAAGFVARARRTQQLS